MSELGYVIRRVPLTVEGFVARGRCLLCRPMPAHHAPPGLTPAVALQRLEPPRHLGGAAALSEAPATGALEPTLAAGAFERGAVSADNGIDSQSSSRGYAHDPAKVTAARRAVAKVATDGAAASTLQQHDFQEEATKGNDAAGGVGRDASKDLAPSRVPREVQREGATGRKQLALSGAVSSAASAKDQPPRGVAIPSKSGEHPPLVEINEGRRGHTLREGLGQEKVGLDRDSWNASAAVPVRPLGSAEEGRNPSMRRGIGTKKSTDTMAEVTRAINEAFTTGNAQSDFVWECNFCHRTNSFVIVRCPPPCNRWREGKKPRRCGAKTIGKKQGDPAPRAALTAQGAALPHAAASPVGARADTIHNKGTPDLSLESAPATAAAPVSGIEGKGKEQDKYPSPKKLTMIKDITIAKGPMKVLGLRLLKSTEMNKGGFTVHDIVRGGAAEVEGSINVGDEIISTNGKDVAGWSLKEVMKEIQAADPVIFDVLRPSASTVEEDRTRQIENMKRVTKVESSPLVNGQRDTSALVGKTGNDTKKRKPDEEVNAGGGSEIFDFEGMKAISPSKSPQSFRSREDADRVVDEPVIIETKDGAVKSYLSPIKRRKRRLSKQRKGECGRAGPQESSTNDKHEKYSASTDDIDEELTSSTNEGAKGGFSDGLRVAKSSNKGKMKVKRGNGAKTLDLPEGAIRPKKRPKFDKEVKTFIRPSGASPKGKVWDASRGFWVADINVNCLLIEEFNEQEQRSNTSAGLSPACDTIRTDDNAKKLPVGLKRPRFPPKLDKVTNLYKKPQGRAPRGMVWDGKHGVWVSDESQSKKRDRASMELDPKEKCIEGKKTLGSLSREKEGEWQGSARESSAAAVIVRRDLQPLTSIPTTQWIKKVVILSKGPYAGDSMTTVSSSANGWVSVCNQGNGNLRFSFRPEDLYLHGEAEEENDGGHSLHQGTGAKHSVEGDGEYSPSSSPSSQCKTSALLAKEVAAFKGNILAKALHRPRSKSLQLRMMKALVKLCSKDETLALKAVEVCGTDLVGAIFKAMSVFLKNAELQVAACVALEYISYYDVSASMISTRADYVSIITTMISHPSKMKVQYHGKLVARLYANYMRKGNELPLETCFSVMVLSLMYGACFFPSFVFSISAMGALQQIVKEGEGAKMVIIRAGVLQAVAKTMNKFSSDANVLDQACLFSNDLLWKGSDSVRTAIVASDLPDLILTGLKKFPRNVKILESGLLALSALASSRNAANNSSSGEKMKVDIKLCEKLVIDKGLTEVIAGVFALQAATADTLNACCHSLNNLTQEEGDISDRICEAGCIGAVIGGMRRFPKCESVQYASCSFLRNLTFVENETYVKTIVREGGLAAITSSLKEFPGFLVLQQEALAALSNIGPSKLHSHKGRAEMVSTAQAILDSMDMHNEDHYVSRWGCIALQRLSSEYEEVKTLLNAKGTGAKRILLAARSRFPDECQDAVDEIVC